MVSSAKRCSCVRVKDTAENLITQKGVRRIAI